MLKIPFVYFLERRFNLCFHEYSLWELLWETLSLRLLPWLAEGGGGRGETLPLVMPLHSGPLPAMQGRNLLVKWDMWA